LVLHAAESVPVHAPALAQSLRSALWRLSLSAAAGANPPPLAWQEALGSLLGAEFLPLLQPDQRGRMRPKDLRPYLLDLHWYEWQLGGVSIGLEARVEPNGRSLKPEQLRLLLEPLLQQPLRLLAMRREQLRLAC
jgi:hypothetical protein